MRKKRVIGEKERAELRLALTDCLISLRKRRDISQERLAAETGTGRAYMSALERGMHSPTIETIYKLLRGLGVTYSEFAVEFEHSLARVQRRNKNRG